MKRYQIDLQVTGLESESGWRQDDKRIWRGGDLRITVTEEILEDSVISLGQSLEDMVRQEIAKHEESK